VDSANLREEHRLLRDQIARFVREEIQPNGDQWEQDGCVPREMLRKMGEIGLLGLRVPEEYGGSGMDALASAVLAEELGRSTYAGANISAVVHTDMAMPHLVRYGTEEQKKKYLPKLASGEMISAIAVTEPGAGSDVAAIRTRAEREGNDAWKLNGAKMFITNGVHADVYFVAAKTDPAAGHRGITMFIVDKDTEGFSVARPLDKFGWRSSDTAELAFEDAVIPAANQLGDEGRGFYAIMENFQNERLVIGAAAMGEAAKAIELTLDYVTGREAFGRTLWDNQVIRNRLAMLASKVEAGRALVYHAAWLDAEGRDCVKEVSMLKAYCGELVNEVMYACQQFHGGMGYMTEMPIERMVRDARIASIGGGATEVMLEEVAKRMV